MSRFGLALFILVPACLDLDGGPPVMTGSTGAASTSTSDSSGPGDASSTGPADTSTGASGTLGDSDSGTTSGPGSTSTTSTATSNDTSPGTSGRPGYCGDGQLDPDEECDHGVDNDLGAECDLLCNRRRIVFITSKEFQPTDIGSLALADGICRQLAGAADLPNWKTFTAWLSDSKTDAGARLYFSNGNYVRPDGVVVVRSTYDFGSGQLEAPILVDETNTLLEGAGAWTGTLADGTAVPGAQHCNDWTSESSQITGHMGDATRIDSGWTNIPEPEVNPAPCFIYLRMYCIEGK